MAKLHGIDGGWHIRTMPLYGDLQRIENELTALGIGPDASLQEAQLQPFDQLHYHGIDAVRAAAGLIGLGRGQRVLDLGAGFGGPARHLAHTVGCHVTALELQPDVHDLAASLTRRCGLDELVDHVLGDALTCSLPDNAFDAVVSWLAIHHIPQRPRLLERLARTLRPGGRLFIEDLVLRAPFAPEDLAAVRHTLYGVTITDVDEYVEDLVEAGFSEIDVTDMSMSWATYAKGRAAAFIADRARHDRVHGVDVAVRLEAFFVAVDGLFSSGSLGGVRITAHL